MRKSKKNISSDFENSEFCAPSREKIRYALYFFNVKIPLGGVPDYGEKICGELSCVNG